MSERAWNRLIPNATGLVAAVLVAVGVFLWMFVDEGLLLVAGLGAFGPGILRELGVLNDQDEFQREAARRAGYHAYLVGGLLAIVILSVLEWSGGEAVVGGEWVGLVLVVLWLSWLASSVMEYRGHRRRRPGSCWPSASSGPSSDSLTWSERSSTRSPSRITGSSSSAWVP